MNPLRAFKAKTPPTMAKPTAANTTTSMIVVSRGWVTPFGVSVGVGVGSGGVGVGTVDG